MNNLVFNSLDIEKQTVLASELYQFLELEKSQYSRWVKLNILENSFVEEGNDYSTSKSNNIKNERGRPSKDYELSIDFAKKLCMVSKSKKGEQIRNYFLDIENRFLKAKENYEQNKMNISLEQVFQPLNSMMKSLENIIQKVDLYTSKITNLNERILRVEQENINKRVPESVELEPVTPTQIGSMFNPSISAQEVNKMLREVGFQHKVGKEWCATEKGKKYSIKIPKHDIELDKTYYQLLWQRKVYSYLYTEQTSLF